MGKLLEENELSTIRILNRRVHLACLADCLRMGIRYVQGTEALKQLRRDPRLLDALVETHRMN